MANFGKIYLLSPCNPSAILDWLGILIVAAAWSLLSSWVTSTLLLLLRILQKVYDGSVKEKRPTIFTTPVTLKDSLCAFLGLPNGSQKTPADVTRAFSAYVESHKLKDAEKGHTIHPDAAMRKVLGVKEGEQVTYRNIQSYLYKLYLLPEKKAKTATA